MSSLPLFSYLKSSCSRHTAATAAASPLAAAAAGGAAAAAPTAASASLHTAPPTVGDELAAVERRLLAVAGEIASVEAQLAAAISKRDCESEPANRQVFHDDVQRLSRMEEQLRHEKALLLKKEERLHGDRERAGEWTRTRDALLRIDRATHSSLTLHAHRVFARACVQSAF